MSGIFGIFQRDRRPVDPFDLERMADSLAHRGPDGTNYWLEGPVGLGHCMLWTTPESLHERLPYEQNRLVITADARLDNRTDLLAALNVADRPNAVTSDSQLILAAYQKWGIHCPERLLGAFVFVIWDHQQQQLFCARDHFGVRPFYYYVSDQTFAFASEIKALRCLRGVPCTLNNVRIGEYLAGFIGDTTSTFFQDISRLPPAHSLIVEPGRISSQRYWDLDPAGEIRLGSDQAYADRFRELFTEAVRCRLRRAYPVGTMLSGGLDSSAVTCVARQLLAQEINGNLPTFSAVYDRLQVCDERPYIQAILDQGGCEPHYIRGDQIGALTDIDQILWHQDEPFMAPQLYVLWHIYATIKMQGLRLMLDGNDGDTTVSHGYGYLDELASAGQWLALAQNTRGIAKLRNESGLRLFWLYIRDGLQPQLSRYRSFNRSRQLWRTMQRQLLPGADSDGRSFAWQSLANSQFIKKIDLVERYRRWWQTQPQQARTEKERHYRSLTQPLIPFALEVFDHTSAAFSVESRSPFWDKRLVEFCLGLPPEQKLDRGWSRLILRRAMAGILPSKIQWRADKTDFYPNLQRGLLQADPARLESLVSDELTIISEYVDIAALKETYRRCRFHIKRQRRQDVLLIWQVVALALWLKNIESTPKLSLERGNPA